MTALVWHGEADIRCDTVSGPAIEHPRDAICSNAYQTETFQG